MPGKETFHYIVQHIHQDLADVRSYTFDFGLSPFRFEPGQFVVGSIDYHSERLQAALTLSSSPTNRESFELTVKRTGNFGTKFYDVVQEGDVIEMTQPSGPFKLDINDTRPIFFIGRDYTVPAARGFYRYLVETNSTRPFALVHEISSPNELLYNEEFSSGKLKTFVRFAMLDAEIRPEGWRGLMGRISAPIIEKIVKQLNNTVFYVSAEGVDMKYFKAELAKLPIDPQNIHLERWS
ncbi:MAG: hypothetical protein JNN15_11750 [Blastocatellia bacterium]|nr:hypothetical protein [Blastocatellia bacterium]